MNATTVIEHIKGEILSVVSNFVELKKAGTNYSARCPFHNEKTASFNVNPAKGIYKCFGCGKGGNAINFIMEHEGVDFKQAVELGAKKLKIDFEWKTSTDFDKAKYQHRESLHIACNIVERFYAEKLSHPEAQKYLKARNIISPAHGSFDIPMPRDKPLLLPEGIYPILPKSSI
jgi:DNA primase